MYKLGRSKRLEKGLKVCGKGGYGIEKLEKGIKLLVENGSLG